MKEDKFNQIPTNPREKQRKIQQKGEGNIVKIEDYQPTTVHGF